MNNAVATLGAEQGVPCPVNRALTAIIKAMEAQAQSLLPKKML
jgi:ketopantoate reductase